MKLHHDGIPHNLTATAAKLAQASHPVWLGGQTPRMQSQPTPNAVRQILKQFIQLIAPPRDNQRWDVERRRVVPTQRRVQRVLLTAIGVQLSALPPPFLRFEVKIPALG